MKSNSNHLQPSIQKVLTPFIKYHLGDTLDRKPQDEGVVYVFGPGESEAKNKSKHLEVIVEAQALSFQKNELLKTEKRVIHFVGKHGPVWIVFVEENLETHQDHYGLLAESSYAFCRDQFGTILNQAKNLKINKICIVEKGTTASHLQAAVIGLELASYHFLKIYKNEKEETVQVFIDLKKDELQTALTNAQAVQLARHLVNLPPNDINPDSIQKLIPSLKFSKNTKVTIWDEKKCQSENMNLLLAVGAGSKTPPRMIHFKYRPTKKTKMKPVAFVGKGITFDTGGLDIKPSSSMRLMKKDMGGAASVLALAYWVDSIKLDRPCDFYLALAENSVDASSMRPSDLYRSRAGFVVEIDNTDAEGRLVLADVMDVAVTQKGPDQPEYLFDIATLTGAIKVALGADVAGLFCNDNEFSEQIMKSGQQVGEPNWRMPLVQKYFSSLNSNFADFKNSGEGFGGAITAALFLQKFVKQTKWAHLDVYCWTDKSTGALTGGAANGQPVQTMIDWLINNS